MSTLQNNRIIILNIECLNNYTNFDVFGVFVLIHEFIEKTSNKLGNKFVK
jgi:hypothetical protein